MEVQARSHLPALRQLSKYPDAILKGNGEEMCHRRGGATSPHSSGGWTPLGSIRALTGNKGAHFLRISLSEGDALWKRFLRAWTCPCRVNTWSPWPKLSPSHSALFPLGPGLHRWLLFCFTPKCWWHLSKTSSPLPSSGFSCLVFFIVLSKYYVLMLMACDCCVAL